MKKYILTVFAAVGLLFTSCDDYLDRPQLNVPDDNTYWKTESDARMFSQGFYTNYFVGYNSGWSSAYAPLRFYYFADDFASTGKQSVFENSVPTSRGTNSESQSTITTYAGENWNFAWIRRANIFLERLEGQMKDVLSEEAYNHWHAVASFYKCFAYARQVATFGDTPYFETTFDVNDLETMYKDRDNRVYVMDKVYDMLKNDVLVNMRKNDGANLLNLYVAAAYASRWMLFEGTWQKYHGGDQAASQKYLQLAKEAAEIVMNSGQYAIDTPLRDLFGSQDLKGNKEALMYRHYTAEMLKHHVASYSNGQESQSPAPNLALIKSFICQDGKVYQKSDLANVTPMTIENLTLTRDPRFEATFVDKPKVQSNTLLYACKFIDRNALTLANPGTVAMYGSNTNTNDAPVIRYSEVLLNWIEAKAELGTATQPDIDKSINALRDRDLAPEAIALGVQKTAHLTLPVAADFDPSRDADVDPLIWEIRRERRMELAYEHSRLADIRRWKKLHYMDNEKYPDTMLGLWINMAEELPALLDADKNGKYTARQVMKEDGTIVTYDGSNAADMVGYYIPTSAKPRNAFSDRNYLAPVGELQISTYSQKGYTLTQTKGW